MKSRTKQVLKLTFRAAELLVALALLAVLLELVLVIVKTPEEFPDVRLINPRKSQASESTSTTPLPPNQPFPAAVAAKKEPVKSGVPAMAAQKENVAKPLPAQRHEPPALLSFQNLRREVKQLFTGTPAATEAGPSSSVSGVPVTAPQIGVNGSTVVIINGSTPTNAPIAQVSTNSNTNTNSMPPGRTNDVASATNASPSVVYTSPGDSFRIALP